jgi:hypothetical protein
MGRLILERRSMPLGNARNRLISQGRFAPRAALVVGGGAIALTNAKGASAARSNPAAARQSNE